LLEAYRKGIFPWFNPGDPVLWWSPDPRMVLMTDSLHTSKSLGKRLRQITRAQRSGQFDVLVTTNLGFEQVLAGCASRGGQDNRGNQAHGTWITEHMMQAYTQWHHAGQVHSIETWIEGKLAGGMYGVCIGQMFFGESMFTRSNNASKIAFAHLVAFLRRNGVLMIDCQMQTDHLASLGAQPIARDRFIEHVKRAVDQPAFAWPSGWLDLEGQLHPKLPWDIDLTGDRIGYDLSP
jgi:leucyl/phenylalanyl-tRNA--protein transferase